MLATFTNNEDVYAEAALLSRATRPSAITERCSGSPGSIYPHHNVVLCDDLLAWTCLSTVSEDDDSFGRSPLQIHPSRAEKKVAQGFRGDAPRDISSDISREAEEAMKSGYLGSSPDPGCEFPASTSPKNTGE